MADRVAGEATVVASRSAGRGGQADDGESWWVEDLGLAVFGKTAFDVVLDVRPPSGEPYRVRVRSKQPNRLFGVRGFLDGLPGPAAGLVLPVLIDPEQPERVEVDWEAFAAQPGARERLVGAVEAAGSTQATEIFAAKIREDPAGFQQRRRLVLDGAQGIVDEVHAGRIPISTLEQFLATNVAPGIITPAEADAFWRSATDASSG